MRRLKSLAQVGQLTFMFETVFCRRFLWKVFFNFCYLVKFTEINILRMDGAATLPAI